ncbi:microsomal epoxide hydrolase [Exophiala viscosa]|uniref:Microsomal epoxide hydrolase n=1 Tax=Exophiala viscosa TaxID=2486360 RepID=A0AAN6DWM5_9EURO|nr:microsomal epoxide hydrolase [Exophiala viscosa]KAI1622465.1 microsomal epoxide hydrolase [Exophiala viscosa]
MAYTHQDSPSDATDPTTLPPLSLPDGVRSRFVDTTPHSLVFHILESLPTNLSQKPQLIVLCHGFPEVGYSWRKILPLLSAQGYHAVAFDQRGYGRTFSRKPLQASSFSPLSLIKDTVTLVHALGYKSVAAIVGHDFGAVTAALTATARPDMFHRLVLMSHPTKGPPQLPTGTSPSYGEPSPAPPAGAATDMEKALSELPQPRKHYKWYYCTPPSNKEMTYPTGGPLHTFLRGYFHLKSADWDGNKPYPLEGWTATELEKMPRYYIMDQDDTMRQGVARDMRDEDAKVVAERSSRWLPDHELAVYAKEYARTTFQGGLNWYRVQTQPNIAAEIMAWSGAKISVPTVFIAGKSDWGTYQEPGAIEAMEQGKSVQKQMYKGTVLVEGAGHWVNQEQPERCVEEILKLIKQDS